MLFVGAKEIVGFELPLEWFSDRKRSAAASVRLANLCSRSGWAAKRGEVEIQFSEQLIRFTPSLCWSLANWELRRLRKGKKNHISLSPCAPFFSVSKFHLSLFERRRKVLGHLSFRFFPSSLSRVENVLGCPSLDEGLGLHVYIFSTTVHCH